MATATNTPPPLAKYDKFMISITRVPRRGVTSIRVMENISTAVSIGDETARILNAGQDYRNKTAGGMHLIQWMFPTGTVYTGQELKAREIFSEDEIDHSGNAKSIGMEIDTPSEQSGPAKEPKSGKDTKGSNVGKKNKDVITEEEGGPDAE